MHLGSSLTKTLESAVSSADIHDSGMGVGESVYELRKK